MARGNNEKPRRCQLRVNRKSAASFGTGWQSDISPLAQALMAAADVAAARRIELS